MIGRILRRIKGRNLVRWDTLGGSFRSAQHIKTMKSIEMVEYLRARRKNDSLKAFHRRRYLAVLRAKNYFLAHVPNTIVFDTEVKKTSADLIMTIKQKLVRKTQKY